MDERRHRPARFDGVRVGEATRRAMEVLARSTPPEAAGYRLFWVAGADVGWMDLPAGGAYAIIGSHDQCDVVLRGDSRVALRHLLATTIALADGLALRLLDLQTHEPFHLEDGAPRDSIVACGMVVAQLAQFVIGAVVTTPGRLELPAAPPRVEMHHAETLPRSVRPPAPAARGPVPTVAPPQDDVSHVSVMPSVSSIGLRRARDDGREAHPPGGDEDAPASVMPPSVAAGGPYRVPPDDVLDPGSYVRELGLAAANGLAPGWARITVRGGTKRATVDVDRAALEVGVLIGRLSSGPDPRLLEVLSGSISRGHVLLFCHHETFEAFDLCSTQGLWLGKAQVRRVQLPPEGATLRLASHDPVWLDWICA